MAKSIGSIIQRAQDLTQDLTGTRWTAAECVRWIEDAMSMVIKFRPDASAATVLYTTLAAGTKQTLPTTYLRLLDAVRNMGATPGETPGKPIRVISRRELDEQRPDWHYASAADDALHFVFDPREPKTFYTFPPLKVGRFLEIIVSKTPDPIESTVTESADTLTMAAGHGFTSANIGDIVYFSRIPSGSTNLSSETPYYLLTVPNTTTFTVSASYGGAQATGIAIGGSGSAHCTKTLTIDDIYSDVVLDLLLWRLFSKNASYAGNNERAAWHKAAADAALGIKTTTDAAAGPKVGAPQAAAAG
jgi:hypothetical protein